MTENKMIKIGAIENNWSWEYDSSTITATLFLKIGGFLVLDVTRRHVKSGLGKGVFETHIGTYDVGTLKKPLKGMINSILKDNKQTYPFQRMGWFNDNECQLSLNTLLLNAVQKNINLARAIKLAEIKKKIQNG